MQNRSEKKKKPRDIGLAIHYSGGEIGFYDGSETNKGLGGMNTYLRMVMIMEYKKRISGVSSPSNNQCGIVLWFGLMVEEMWLVGLHCVVVSCFVEFGSYFG